MSRYEEKSRNNEKKKGMFEDAYSSWNGITAGLFGRMTVKERFLTLCGAVFTGVITYLALLCGAPSIKGITLGPFDGLCYPVADALFCSSGTYAPVAYAVLTVHALSPGSFSLLRAVLITGSFALRIGTSEWRRRGRGGAHYLAFGESPLIKLGSATLLSLVCTAIYVSKNGLDLDVLAQTLTLLLSTPTLCFVFGAFFSGYPTGKGKRPPLAERLYYEISMYSVFALTVWSLKTLGYTFAGCSASALVAIFFTSATAYRGGTVRGGLVGFVLGYIYMPRFAASLAVNGAFIGMLSSSPATLATGIACAASCVTAVITQRYQGFLHWIPECVIALAAVTPVLRYDFLSDGFPLPRRDASETVPTAESTPTEDGRELSTKRLYVISEAFMQLSGDCKKRLDSADAVRFPDIDAVCERLCHGVCDSCPMVSICWENERKRTKDAVKTVGWLLYRPNSSSEIRRSADFPSDFHCLRPNELKKEILRICESREMRASVPEPRRAESFSEEYECVSEMLKDIAETAEKELSADKTSTQRVKKAASSLAFSPSELSVIGKRNKKVIAYGVDASSVGADTERLREAFSRACGVRLSIPVFSSESGGKMVFESTRSFTALSAHAISCNPQEERSGDVCAAFSTDNGYYYSIISDGMGSGSEAAESAEIAASLVKDLLACEIDKELAVRMAGSALRRRGNECFATIDMFELDLMTGAASFLKNGAACSYIVRDGAVYCVSARSMPVGIIAEATPEQVRSTLRDGDTVIMTSDGVAQDAEDGAWLIELIEENAALAPQELADAILEEATGRALRSSPIPISPTHDDMSVVVTRISSVSTSAKAS